MEESNSHILREQASDPFVQPVKRPPSPRCCCFSTFLPLSHPIVFATGSQAQYALQRTTLNLTVVLMELIAGEMGCTASFLTGAFAFSQCLGPPLGVEESICGRMREGETTYGCNLKMLFLVLLKCGKSKSLSLGRLWEVRPWDLWEGGSFDLLVEFSHFQLRGSFAPTGLLNVRNAYLH